MKILHFIHGLHLGGAETFLQNLIISLGDVSDFDFEFVIQDNVITHDFFRNLKITHPEKFNIISNFPRHAIKQYDEFLKLIQGDRYDIVHVHMNSFANPIPILACLRMHIPVIVHSHNTKNAAGGKIGYTLHLVNRFVFNHKINRVACSEEAGKWMFHDEDFEIVNNAIDVDKFIFNRNTRETVRRELGISQSSEVIGMVGRLHPQKNHKRAINIFNEYHAIHPDSKLLIVGDGALKTELQQYAYTILPDYESVRFVGAKQDVAPYYSAMDVLLFPSLYEGLPIVGIEAQASGLKIIASDMVPNGIDVSGEVKFIPLNDSDEIWANDIYGAICNMSDNSRIIQGDKMVQSAYSLANLRQSMTQIYQRVSSRTN